MSREEAYSGPIMSRKGAYNESELKRVLGVQGPPLRISGRG